MLRLATRAPGLGAPPAARPAAAPLRHATPDRMTDAARPRPRRLRRVRQPRLRADRARPARRRLARAWSRASRPRACSCARPRRATRPIPRSTPAPRRARCRRRRPRRRRALRAAVARRRAIPRRCSRASPAPARPRSTSRPSPRRCARGRQALVLLPEIALSVEFLDRVEARFGARPAEWHSGVTQAARRRAWTAVATGDARLVVGARSALFLPFADLGLVVVDEEHDGSYKQEDGALYHARDMAVLRASIEGAAVVLASATPVARDPGPTPTPASTPASTCPSASASPSCPRCARSTCARTRPSPAAGSPQPLARGGHRAPRRRRAVAPLPQPPRLRAADHLPRLRPPGRLRRSATRAWSSTASASAWSATSAARPSRSRPPARPARSRAG